MFETNLCYVLTRSSCPVSLFLTIRESFDMTVFVFYGVRG